MIRKLTQRIKLNSDLCYLPKQNTTQESAINQTLYIPSVNSVFWIDNARGNWVFREGLLRRQVRSKARIQNRIPLSLFMLIQGRKGRWAAVILPCSSSGTYSISNAAVFSLKRKAWVLLYCFYGEDECGITIGLIDRKKTCVKIDFLMVMWLDMQRIIRKNRGW